MDTGKESVVRVVFPGNEDMVHGRISVLKPLGAALLGRRAGDLVEWEIPSLNLTQKARILRIIYQPEKLGHYSL